MRIHPQVQARGAVAQGETRHPPRLPNHSHSLHLATRAGAHGEAATPRNGRKAWADVPQVSVADRLESGRECIRLRLSIRRRLLGIEGRREAAPRFLRSFVVVLAYPARRRGHSYDWPQALEL